MIPYLSYPQIVLGWYGSWWPMAPKSMGHFSKWWVFISSLNYALFVLNKGYQIPMISHFLWEVWQSSQRGVSRFLTGLVLVRGVALQKFVRERYRMRKLDTLDWKSKSFGEHYFASQQPLFGILCLPLFITLLPRNFSAILWKHLFRKYFVRVVWSGVNVLHFVWVL